MLKTSTTDMPARITRVAARPSVPRDAGRRQLARRGRAGQSSSAAGLNSAISFSWMGRGTGS